MYAYIYSFIQKLILKKSLNSDAGNLLKIIKFKNIIDIGCGESDVLNYFKISKNQNYFGYEIDNYFVKKLKKKYKKKTFIF
jgi:16S rRNA A1518/A1519 N6-dimethyltransferase RsmA/KsgA/DIM1 with predicted DNA glycosylase/AP lyase activity